MVSKTNKNSLASLDDGVIVCPSCGSTRFSQVLMPSYHTHHAALKCGGCDRFIAWSQKPETEGKRRDMFVRLNSLESSTLISQWEKDFLKSLKSQKKLSPRQVEVLTRIEAKAGGSRV